MPAPQFPAGPFVPVPAPTPEQRVHFVEEITAFPAALRAAVDGLAGERLDAQYRNWSVRQIVHHLADSHVNSYVRFKWALTEDRPTIKAYDETAWAALADSRTADVALPLALLEALHARWVALLRTLTEGQFGRAYVHPETGDTVTLNLAVGLYAWHGRHHLAQVRWVRQQRGW